MTELRVGSNPHQPPRKGHETVSPPKENMHVVPGKRDKMMLRGEQGQYPRVVVEVLAACLTLGRVR